MHRAKNAKRVELVKVNPVITCKLCKGYFIDATTIVECLHTFCRSCIVQYLSKNKYCPVCDVQVHKTKPLLNIRPDKIIQDIVYKLVPRLFQNEIQRRRVFYDNHPEGMPSATDWYSDGSYQHLLAPEESICLVLSYHGCSSNSITRYFRCPAAVSVGHLQKLIQAKYDLSDSKLVDILYNQDCLNSSLTLMDVAYIYLWKKNTPLALSYRISESSVKRPKLETPQETIVHNHHHNNNNNNWKEVQLRISENGEMSITGIQDNNLLLDNLLDNSDQSKYKKPSETTTVTTVTEEEEKVAPPTSTTTTSAATCIITTASSSTATTRSSVVASSIQSSLVQSYSTISSSAATTKTVFSTINSKCSTKTQDEKPPVAPPVENHTKAKRKAEDVVEDVAAAKQPKPTILNHSIGLLNLSNNHPLKKHSKFNRVENSTPSTSQAELTRPQKPQPCYMPIKTTANYNPVVINVPKPTVSTSKIMKAPLSTGGGVATPSPVHNHKLPPQGPQQQQQQVKSKPNTPIGYKTLRDPPKSWNSQISKVNSNKAMPGLLSKQLEVQQAVTVGGGGGAATATEMKNVRPAKFFKMRNNLPRYLGNPASGVKPMYQVHVSPEKDKVKDKTKSSPASNSEPTTNRPVEKSPEIRKHSIVKIDPKTLKPISEKAPETSSLSTMRPQQKTSSSCSDLKINTSSVSIFNPLKLQQHSPKNDHRKSPHSPKLKANCNTTTISTTSSCSSPTTNKRCDKANLNFTPANPFIPNLNSSTLNHPNQFLYPPYNAHNMMAALHWYRGMSYPSPSPPHISVAAAAAAAAAFGLSPATSAPVPYTPPPALKAYKPAKKSPKETVKPDKSLQNAVEKLTQNRAKAAAAAVISEVTTATTTITTSVTKESNVSNLNNSSLKIATTPTTTTTTTTTEDVKSSSSSNLTTSSSSSNEPTTSSSSSSHEHPTLSITVPTTSSGSSNSSSNCVVEGGAKTTNKPEVVVANNKHKTCLSDCSGDAPPAPSSDKPAQQPQDLATTSSNSTKSSNGSNNINNNTENGVDESTSSSSISSGGVAAKPTNNTVFVSK